MQKRLGTIMIGIAAALTIGACSPPGENPSDQPPGAENRPTELPGVSDMAGSGSKTPTSAAKASGAAGECTADDVEVAGSFGSKPNVTIPQDCAAPTTLLTKDLKTGDGQEAGRGSTVEANYQLVTWSSGEVADGNFGSGKPLTVRDLGNASQTIEGWNKGLVGIKEGGRRLLVVPPEMAYGETGNGSIGPNETLVFVIDAVAVRSA